MKKLFIKKLPNGKVSEAMTLVLKDENDFLSIGSEYADRFDFVVDCTDLDNGNLILLNSQSNQSMDLTLGDLSFLKMLIVHLEKKVDDREKIYELKEVK